MKQALPLLAFVIAAPAIAETTRQLDAHEHGVGTLDIAIDGTTVAMAFEAPGADIVGFEYAATTDADRAAVETALGILSAPLDLFVLPDAAGCSVTMAKAELEIEDAHDGHDDHGEHKDDGHDDHHDEHDHDEDKHDEHGHDDHDEHDEHEHDGHEDHGHEDHAEGTGHSAFHAEYQLTCASPDALSSITFAYFETFPNALEVEVQLLTSSGARAFEVERAEPVLTLE